MKETKFLNFLIILIIFSGCKSVFHPGFFDKEDYLLFKNFPSKHCGKLEICFSKEEITAWNRDSLGLLGDRRKIFLRNADRFKHGELNGLSYECLIDLLGIPIDKYSHPESDSSFTYQISQNHDSIIELGLWYNQYFDKVVDSYISISVKDLPGKATRNKCSIQFYTMLDSVFCNDLYKTEETVVVLPKGTNELYRLCYLIFRDESILNKFNNQPIECFECYFGKPDSYIYSFGEGIWGNYFESVVARFSSSTFYYDFEVYFSEETRQIEIIKKTHKIIICG